MQKSICDQIISALFVSNTRFRCTVSCGVNKKIRCTNDQTYLRINIIYSFRQTHIQTRQIIVSMSENLTHARAHESFKYIFFQ